MDEAVRQTRGETAAHAGLKRLAILWAQARGYSACAVEVHLPRCRYRADVAAFRSHPNECSAIFECKQAAPDLRRDNCCTEVTRARLESIEKRRQTIEKHLRVHYPQLRKADSLFPEFDSHDFGSIGHRTYSRLLRELAALQHQLCDCRKFETLIRYRCANLFYLVLPNELFCSAEVPIGWGALVERDGALHQLRPPVWHEASGKDQGRFLHRIATSGTRQLNKTLGISFEELLSWRRNTAF